MIADPLAFVLTLAKQEVGPLAAITDAHLRVGDDGEITVLDEPALTEAWCAHLTAAAIRGADISTSLKLIAAFTPIADGPPNLTLQQEIAEVVAPHTSLGKLAGIFTPKGNA